MKKLFCLSVSLCFLIPLLSGCGDSPIRSPKPLESEKPENPSPSVSVTGSDSSPQTNATASLRCDLEFKKVKLCAQMSWVKGPKWNANTEEPMEVQLEFWSPASNERVDLIYELDFDSAMPVMNNHPLATKPRVVRENDSRGVFSVSDIRISCLGGDWSFFFQLKEGRNLVDQVRYIWVRDEHLID